jgi:preprotein translocase subunit SecG
MYATIIGLIIFISVLLVLVILAQNSKGGGLTSQFGGSAASNIIGVKKTGDLLEKLTWGFIIAIIVLSLTSNFVKPSAGSSNEIFDKAAEQAPAVNPAMDLNSNPAGATDTSNTGN